MPNATAVSAADSQVRLGRMHCPLVPKPKVEVFISAMRTQYYAKKFPELSKAQLEDACFDTQPAGGACVYKV